MEEKSLNLKRLELFKLKMDTLSGDCNEIGDKDEEKMSSMSGSATGRRIHWFNIISAVLNLRTTVILIGISEAFVGVTLLTLICVSYDDYDALYGTVESRLISSSSAGCVLCLSLCGFSLIVSVFTRFRRLLWCHVVVSTGLCIYIFALSALQIHFGLLVLEKNPHKASSMDNNYVLSKACILGILTLIASVGQFACNAIVFTYYNIKYVKPIMFNFPPCE